MAPLQGLTTNLQHVPDSGTERVINEAKVQMAPTLNKCRYGRVVGTKWEDAFSQVSEGWI